MIYSRNYRSEEQQMALLTEDKEALLKLKLTIGERRRVRALRDYTAIKKKYFGNTIPDVSCISVVFVPETIIEKQCGKEGCLGCFLGRAGDVLAIIAIEEDSSDCVYLMTLAHEMAHLKVNGKYRRDMRHGKYWQAEMKRLARLGAFQPLW
jgi:hypothetical protein